MGTYLFAGQILSWLPPLIFTGMNEAGVSPRIGIASLSVWFFFGILCLCLVGEYRRAVTMVGREQMLISVDGRVGEESADERANDNHVKDSAEHTAAQG